MDYAELDDLKRFLRIPGVYEGTLNQTPDLYDDIVLQSAITTASRTIDNATNRTFGIVDSPTAYIYEPEWDRNLCKWIVYTHDVMTTSGYQIMTRSFRNDPFDVEITDYTLYPRNASAKDFPWTFVVLHESPGSEVEITATWGWTEVPEAIKYATLVQASRYFKRRDAPFGIAGSPDGNEQRLLAKIDPDVAVIVSPYRKWWGSV